MTWGEDRLLTLAESALGDGEIEVYLTRYDAALTRFAESRIHQNTARVDGEARVRVALDGRIGVVATNDLTPEGLRAAVEAAREAARVTPPDPEYAGLASPSVYATAGVDDDATAESSPADRAAVVAALLAQLPSDAVGAGTVESAREEAAVVNSEGVRAYHRSTRAGLSLLGQGPDSSGWAEDAAGALAVLDVERAARRVASKIELGRGPRDVPPGEYAVVLEPAASVTLVQWLCYLAFGGKAVAEGRSPLSGRIGEQVCSPLVSIADDPLAPEMAGVPFDPEGTPKSRFDLIRDGVAVAVAHDRASARLAGAESTGHALPAPNTEGGIPMHARLEAGQTSYDDLVAGLDRGLLVTRFHYTNVVHPIESTITGMTRDGTFLVEDGRIVGGVRNLRFTQSILVALRGTEAVGDDTEMASELFFGSCRAPSLRLSKFAFSSATTF